MIAVLILFVVMLVLQLLTPFWWWIVVIPFAYGLWKGPSGWKAFQTGALSAAALWFLAASYELLTASWMIARRVAEMMSIGSPWLLLVATSVIAFVAAGAAGTTGYFLRAAFRSEPSSPPLL